MRGYSCLFKAHICLLQPDHAQSLSVAERMLRRPPGSVAVWLFSWHLYACPAAFDVSDVRKCYRPHGHTSEDVLDNFCIVGLLRTRLCRQFDHAVAACAPPGHTQPSRVARPPKSHWLSITSFSRVARTFIYPKLHNIPIKQRARSLVVEYSKVATR